MGKLKTHKSIAKRLKITGTGKVKHYHAYLSHLTGKKAPSRKRRLRKPSYLSHAVNKIKKLLPYG